MENRSGSVWRRSRVRFPDRKSGVTGKCKPAAQHRHRLRPEYPARATSCAYRHRALYELHRCFGEIMASKGQHCITKLFQTEKCSRDMSEKLLAGHPEERAMPV